ncbi:exopolysaccharide biosynthesis protein [Opitutales bacterium ASA1]|uniref:exopolysaccharide biosynthesis protein n=1 Tax=Congregicoccus parvus TaxID=3081749 RepID=UPI002B2E8D89|nr:exopolysaccharide biosynthesis protein [Opitutales bacterium ASA1]
MSSRISKKKPKTLAAIVDALDEAADDGDEVAIADMLEAVGRRSFAPVLLMAGLIAVSPMSGIPGVPSVVATMVATVSLQVLFGRERLWLPRWVTRRTITRDRFRRGLKALRKPSRVVDRFIRPRWEFFTHDIGMHAMAAMVVLLALTMPPLEIVPFAASTAGAAISAFALSLLAHDGVLAVVAFVLTGTAATLMFRALFG